MLPSGKRIGPYEILSSLGVGGMGEVYRARDSRLKREVAIKILPQEVIANPERQKRFQREAESASALNHPNILAVYDIGSEDGSQYIVSELVQGTSLRKQLQSGPLPIRLLLEIATQIADGLVAAHSAGIIHRDLKPENVMVGPDNRVKILDFGLAKLIHTETLRGDAETVSRSLTQTGVIYGTLAYMSPEQATGGEVDFRSDQFSFGLLLYEMATGKKAFERPTAAETIAAVISEDVPTLPVLVPPPLRWIIERCLTKKPEQRYESTRDLQRDLHMIRDHLAEVVTTQTRPGQKIRDKRSWVALLAGILIGTFLVAFCAKYFGLFSKPVVQLQPELKRLTFRRGTVYSARFAPDGHTIVYSAAWDGNPPEIYTGVAENAEARSTGLKNAQILSISRTGEMAVLLHARYEIPDIGLIGTLARMPYTGGAPRVLVEDVFSADWAPNSKDLVVMRSSGGMFRIEFPIGNVLYKTPIQIRDVRISPKGNQIAFLKLGDSDSVVALVDLSGREQVVSKGWSYLWGLAWSPSGEEIYFAGSKGKVVSKEVYAVALNGKSRLVLPLTADVRFQDVSNKDDLLFIANNVRAQMNICRVRDAQERDLSWFDWSWLRDISADGKYVLFNELSEGTGGWTDTAYIREIDSPSAVRLAEANPFEFSPDGKWVLAGSSQGTDLMRKQLMLVPTGLGKSRILPKAGIEMYDGATWFPDGKRIAFAGTEKGHAMRIYIQQIEDGLPIPISKENTRLPYGTHPVSPDGKKIAIVENDNTVVIQRIPGGESHTIPNLEKPNIEILGWTNDGRALYLRGGFQVPLPIYILDPATGNRKLWRELSPPDRAGVTTVFPAYISPDGKVYGYTYERALSDLYMLSGVK